MIFRLIDGERKNTQILNKYKVSTKDLLAPSPAKLLRQVDSCFVVNVKRKELSDAEYQVEKNKFIESPDMKQIFIV